MNRVGVLMWALLVFPAGALGDEEVAQDQPSGGLTDPVEILKKTDAAAKTVEIVRYKVKAGTPGASQESAPEVEGTYLLSGFTGMGPQKFMIDVTVRQPSSEDVKHYTAGGDGEKFFLIDHNAKKAYQDIDPNVMGSANRVIWAGAMFEFVHPTPFNDEINGKDHKLGEGKTIGDVECYEVQVVYANEQKATWYLSKDDFLPRGRVDEFKRRDGSTVTQQKFLTNVETGAGVKDAKFTLELPEGYEKIDDFAP